MSAKPIATHQEGSPARSKNHPEKPVLSLILCSRNDQYMGNSLWRLETALNYLALCVGQLGKEDAVEVLVSDWGSDRPLHEDLKLSPLAAKMVSFLIVPPALAQRSQKDSPFSEVHALNAAARRVNGKYIGRIDQDTLVGKRFLTAFFDMYEGKASLPFDLDSVVLFSNRRSIPYKFAVHCPPFGHVSSFIGLFGGSLKVLAYNPAWPEAFWTSFVGIFLLSRNLWEVCGGYNENLIYYDWMETEMILRLAGRAPVIDLGAQVGHDFYHLDHYQFGAPSPITYHRRKDGYRNPAVNIQQPAKDLHPNDADWGLHREALQIASSPDNGVRAATDTVGERSVRWLTSTIVFLSTGAEVLWETMLIQGAPGQLFRRWKGRLTRARIVVHGQPFMDWPRLLARAWATRGQNR